MNNTIIDLSTQIAKLVATVEMLTIENEQLKKELDEARGKANE